MGAVIWSVFFLVFVACDGMIQTTDSKYVVPSAISLVQERNLDVKEFFAHSSGFYQPSDYQLDTIGEGYYSRYPLCQTLLAVPFVWVAVKLGDMGMQKNPSDFSNLELIIACAVAAGCCVLMYWIARLRLDILRALIVTLVFGLGTSMWSTAGRALWQHGPSVFLLTLSLLMLLQAESRPRLVAFVALPLALSYLMRPTNAIPVAVFTLYVFWKYPQYFLRYMLISGLAAVPFLAFNLHMYGFPLSPYFTPGTLGIPRHQAEAVVGLLVSPSRGLFVFSPVLLFSLYGIALKLARKGFTSLDLCLLVILAGHVAAVAFSNPMWWAGHSFGPRFMTDMLPFLTYFLIPLFQDSCNWTSGKAVILWGLFTAALLFSGFVHYSGACCPQAWEWNGTPTNIDRDLTRLWDWKDSQALRALKLWLQK